MEEHDEFWEPTRNLWKAVKSFLIALPEHVRRWTPVLLLLILVVELINIAGVMGHGSYSAVRLYVHTALAAGACIGLGVSVSNRGKETQDNQT